MLSLTEKKLKDKLFFKCNSFRNNIEDHEIIDNYINVFPPETRATRRKIKLKNNAYTNEIVEPFTDNEIGNEHLGGTLKKSKKQRKYKLKYKSKKRRK